MYFNKNIGKRYGVFIDKIYIIQRIVGNKDMVHRLQSLGFVVGSKISVLSEINGNYVVVIKDIKIGLAKEYVKRIIVA